MTCTISGRVQGMLYRDFARRTARRLGLVGEVYNVPGGTVRVVAQGDEAALKKFIEYLKRGSTFSHVDEVVVEWSEPAGTFSDFQIKYRNFFDRL